MQRAKFVFFNAEAGCVSVTINSVPVGAVNNSEDLVALLQQSGVTLEDEMFHSSSVDFATEYGFSDDNGAYRIIEPALEML
jgi:hypothetical protein